MRLYCGIDLHSNNALTKVLDEGDRTVYSKRLPNDLGLIVSALEPYRPDLVGIAVESTFNWYWLVDGLMEWGYRVHLANPSAMRQYEGLKYTDDSSDAGWLARLLRLGLLPEGYIYPKEDRPLRDLLRKRIHLVRQRTANLLSLQNILHRNTGRRLSGRALMSLDLEAVRAELGAGNLMMSVESTLQVLRCLDEQARRVEQEVLGQVRPDPVFRLLKTIPGVGEILATTIRLETGQIGRFASTGRYVSYCRAVGSQKLSNGKFKGQGNRKNGNAYLAWAWLEAANFGIRHHEMVRGWYQRKLSRTHRVVALKAVAHKLARAGYHVMRDGVPFEMPLAFG